MNTELISRSRFCTGPLKLLPLIAAVVLGFSACSINPRVQKAPDSETAHISQGPENDIELLTRMRYQHTQFLQKQFELYHRKYPNVTREDYMDVVQNQPRDFCIFKHFPVNECNDVANYEYKRGKKKSAYNAYRAVVLSHEYNKPRHNIRVYGALTQISLENNDLYNAQIYISKIFSINGENRWAKNKLIDVLSSK